MISEADGLGIRRALGSLLGSVMTLAKLDIALGDDIRDDDFRRQAQALVEDSASIVAGTEAALVKLFEKYTLEKRGTAVKVSIPECDWEYGISEKTIETVSKYFAAPGTPGTPMLGRRKRSKDAPAFDLIEISCDLKKYKRKGSRSDICVEYKKRLDYELTKIKTNFNIVYCVGRMSHKEFYFGTKNQARKQDLVKFETSTETCTKIMTVGMIIDIIFFGHLAVIAERNEPIKVYRGNLLLLTLSQVFQPQYFQNQFGNDSRIFKAYKTERLYYITQNDTVVEYNVTKMFQEKIIQVDKNSRWECICVQDDYLFMLTRGGEVVKYSILEEKEESRFLVERSGFLFCTITSCRDYLIISGMNPVTETNVIQLVNSHTDSVKQEIELIGLKYPIHQIHHFDFFNVMNVAFVYKDSSSVIYLYVLDGGKLQKVMDIKIPDNMVYDIFYTEDAFYCCSWANQDEITKVNLKILAID